MSEVRAAEEALAQQVSAEPVMQMALGKTLNSKVVTLSGRLPQIWADVATTDAHRKALLRCLVEKVVLDRGEHDVAVARIVWRGGAVTELEVKMKVNSVAKLTRGEEMRARLLDLRRCPQRTDHRCNRLRIRPTTHPHCDAVDRKRCSQATALSSSLLM
ncbi:hypothetical protein [Mesorhizobium sp. M1A.F.Ca.IN.022.06.1.1]|uniref:hypothetical protein n=1 Tax=Mesorhizobium sp. M1A.F.Ca.IN.022.06.1.1 TaxID=2493680 RepID=UPI001FDF7D0D|nr:hypothetical protein [Mesorhizobium sp. M1A.F.Ca.IN.022.06.1.1]